MTKYVLHIETKQIYIDQASKIFDNLLNWPTDGMLAFNWDTETNSGIAEYYDRTVEHTSLPEDINSLITLAQQDLDETKRIEALPFYERPDYDSWERVREERDSCLKATDLWLVPKDRPIVNKQSLIDFRAFLRDIPQTYADVTPKDIRFIGDDSGLRIEVNGSVVTSLPEEFI